MLLLNAADDTTRPTHLPPPPMNDPRIIAQRHLAQAPANATTKESVTTYDEMARTKARDEARAQAQLEGPSLADVDELCAKFGFHCDDHGESIYILRDMITAAITRWPLPALQPPAQPVNLAELHDPGFSDGLTPIQHLDVVHGGADPRVAATPAQVQGVSEDRYEFSVVDSDDCEVAGGSVPTLDDAIREGRNYLRQYNQNGPHKLELRRVLVLDYSEATHA